MDIPRQRRGGVRLPSLDRIVAYTSIVGGVCTPPILFFAASGFFQWTPSTFMGLGIMSAPVGTAVIALILGGCPWAVVGYTYRHKRRRLPLSVASADAPKQTPAELQYRPINGIELLEFMESAKLASAADAFFTPTPVKILYSDKGHDVADQLARALILLNFEVMVNHDNASHLFPTGPGQPSGIRLRGPLGNRIVMMVGTGLSGAHLNCTKVEFPKDEKYNYTQIEIGDPTTDSYWDRSGPAVEP
jgi:hypothetical protein